MWKVWDVKTWYFQNTCFEFLKLLVGRRTIQRTVWNHIYAAHTLVTLVSKLIYSRLWLPPTCICTLRYVEFDQKLSRNVLEKLKDACEIASEEVKNSRWTKVKCPFCILPSNLLICQIFTHQQFHYSPMGHCEQIVVEQSFPVGSKLKKYEHEFWSKNNSLKEKQYIVEKILWVHQVLIKTALTK